MTEEELIVLKKKIKSKEQNKTSLND